LSGSRYLKPPALPEVADYPSAKMDGGNAAEAPGDEEDFRQKVNRIRIANSA
jgi:hypothetical protein